MPTSPLGAPGGLETHPKGREICSMDYTLLPKTAVDCLTILLFGFFSHTNSFSFLVLLSTE